MVVFTRTQAACQDGQNPYSAPYINCQAAVLAMPPGNATGPALFGDTLACRVLQLSAPLANTNGVTIRDRCQRASLLGGGVCSTKLQTEKVRFCATYATRCAGTGLAPAYSNCEASVSAMAAEGEPGTQSDTFQCRQTNLGLAFSSVAAELHCLRAALSGGDHCVHTTSTNTSNSSATRAPTALAERATTSAAAPNATTAPCSARRSGKCCCSAPGRCCADCYTLYRNLMLAYGGDASAVSWCATLAADNICHAADNCGEGGSGGFTATPTPTPTPLTATNKAVAMTTAQPSAAAAPTWEALGLGLCHTPTGVEPASYSLLSHLSTRTVTECASRCYMDAACEAFVLWTSSPSGAAFADLDGGEVAGCRVYGETLPRHCVQCASSNDYVRAGWNYRGEGTAGVGVGPVTQVSSGTREACYRKASSYVRFLGVGACVDGNGYQPEYYYKANTSATECKTKCLADGRCVGFKSHGAPGTTLPTTPTAASAASSAYCFVYFLGQALRHQRDAPPGWTFDRMEKDSQRRVGSNVVTAAIGDDGDDVHHCCHSQLDAAGVAGRKTATPTPIPPRTSPSSTLSSVAPPGHTATQTTAGHACEGRGCFCAALFQTLHFA